MIDEKTIIDELNRMAIQIEKDDKKPNKILVSQEIYDREMQRRAFKAGREGADIKGYDHEDEECDIFTGSMMSAKVVFKYETFEDYMKDKGGECD